MSQASPVTLILRKSVGADALRGRVPAVFYDIVVDDAAVGTIQLRFGDSITLPPHAGHIGYEVAPAHRGHGYAATALRLLLPIAAAHGFSELWITCHPDNIASRRTLEAVGACHVETVAVPPDSDLFARGDRAVRRYRLETWEAPCPCG